MPVWVADQQPPGGLLQGRGSHLGPAAGLLPIHTALQLLSCCFSFPAVAISTTVVKLVHNHDYFFTCLMCDWLEITVGQSCVSYYLSIGAVYHFSVITDV